VGDNTTGIRILHPRLNFRQLPLLVFDIVPKGIRRQPGSAPIRRLG
jgi:hypothetical protein